MSAPTFAEAVRVWARIGCLSFGGPAGQIALMHREIVEQRKWLDEPDYLNALNFCMLLPGPEAMQLATYAGWRLHGVRGGLAAGLLFVLPGALVVLALTMAYAAFGRLAPVEAAFVGIKAAVLVIVVEALLRIARRALHAAAHWTIAAAAFVGIFLFEAPFPLIVGAAAAIGFALAPQRRADGPAEPWPSPRRTLATLGLWLAVWLVPLGLLWALLGGGHVLAEIGAFFSMLAVVTFGGAYAVLAYMAQAAVETHGWLDAGEMLDGLGLAETTPGPLILVTEFVGYLGAARSGGEASLLRGLAGAAVTLWATFAPCFLWVFAGAPYVQRIARAPRLRAALQGITAAVVGVILNLSLWFGLHVLAPGIQERATGPLRWWTLPPDGIDPVAAVLAAVAAVALLALHQGVLRTLVLCGGLALAWYALQAPG
ncbi:MAG: chromate efflux transporter [Alphaproteobacteria bacterium]